MGMRQDLGEDFNDLSFLSKMIAPENALESIREEFEINQVKRCEP
jgi:hypothetical protein